MKSLKSKSVTKHKLPDKSGNSDTKTLHNGNVAIAKGNRKVKNKTENPDIVYNKSYENGHEDGWLEGYNLALDDIIKERNYITETRDGKTIICIRLSKIEGLKRK